MPSDHEMQSLHGVQSLYPLSTAFDTAKDAAGWIEQANPQIVARYEPEGFFEDSRNIKGSGSAFDDVEPTKAPYRNLIKQKEKPPRVEMVGRSPF